jgi:hypothetical protein
LLLKGNGFYMDQNYQQLDLHSLIDLLAEETEKHTKAFISGILTEVAFHRANIIALIAEIEHRKQGNFSPSQYRLESPPDQVSDATPTTTD